jgi:hypothetical protein
MAFLEYYMLPLKGRDLLSKREIKKVIFSVAFGFIGAILAIVTLGPENKKSAMLMCSLFAAVAYFWISNRLFKN